MNNSDVKVTDNTKAYIEAMEAASERILEAIGIEVERAAKKGKSKTRISGRKCNVEK